MINPVQNPSIAGETSLESDEMGDLPSCHVSVSGLAPISTAIQTAWPNERWRDCGVVVGCSGGADSVALVVALCALRDDQNAETAPRGVVRIVHVNHGLRGDASDGDEQYVRALASRLGLEFLAVRLSGSASDEATLRSAREAVFSEHAHSIGARYVAVGHSADDNAETVLHHLFRGTGPSGLAGIAPFRALGEDAVLVRPMLSVRRETIRQVLRTNSIEWREDASNSDTHYTRNWIRHELLPLVESRYPDAVQRVANAISLQREWRLFIERQAAVWLDENRITDNKTHSTQTDLHIRRGSTSDGTLIVEALQQCWRQAHWSRVDMTAAHWIRIVRSIQSLEPERYTLPGSIDVVADEHCVRLRAT